VRPPGLSVRLAASGAQRYRGRNRPVAMVVVEDFEIGGYIGRSRPSTAESPFRDADVVRAVHRSSKETFAMKRIEVAPDLAKARELLTDLTRGACLEPHDVWLRQYPEYSFVHEYVDKYNRKHARCCVVHEIAEKSLERDIVDRAVGENGQNSPYVGIFTLWAALLHGLQAFHAQGCLHRGISPHNIFFQGDRIKLGVPAPTAASPSEGYYFGGDCLTYSSDIFALGLVFLEMSLLHQAADLVGGDPNLIVAELEGLGNSAGDFREWLWDRCGMLGLPLPADERIFDVLVAMLAVDPASRPTADDLLEWPCFAPFVEPRRLLPVWQRPCVVLAHSAEYIGAPLGEVPRRNVLTLPGFHQIFSREGASRSAVQERRYRWCGREHALWWCADAEPELIVPDVGGDDDDFEDRDSCSAAVGSCAEPGGNTAPLGPPSTASSKPDAATSSRRSSIADAVASSRRTSFAQSSMSPAAPLLALAERHRAAGRLLAAEAAVRKALGVLDGMEAGGILASDVVVSRVWFGLGALLVERGHLMAANDCCKVARQCVVDEDAVAGGVKDAERDARIFGYSELFAAAQSLGAATGQGSPSSTFGCDLAAGVGAAPTMRAVHTSLYYRSTLVGKAEDWEVLAALGEFYRLIGCPSPTLEAPQPDIPTAVSYFEQAKAMAPTSRFVLQRLAILSEEA